MKQVSLRGGSNATVVLHWCLRGDEANEGILYLIAREATVYHLVFTVHASD